MRPANVAFFPESRLPPPGIGLKPTEWSVSGSPYTRTTLSLRLHPTISTPAPYQGRTCAAAPSDFAVKSEGAAAQVRPWYGASTKLIPHLPCAVQDLSENANLRTAGRFGGSGKMFYLCRTDWSVCFSVCGINRRRKALRSPLHSGRIASAEQGGCIGGMQKCCRLSSDVTHRVVSVGFAA